MNMKSYIKVEWLHSFEHEPRLLYSELDAERWEIRKIEVFPDGTLGFANADKYFGKTRLGEAPIPSLLEIAADAQFRPIEIPKTEFDTIWAKATQQT